MAHFKGPKAELEKFPPYGHDPEKYGASAEPGAPWYPEDWTGSQYPTFPQSEQAVMGWVSELSKEQVMAELSKEGFSPRGGGDMDPEEQGRWALVDLALKRKQMREMSLHHEGLSPSGTIVQGGGPQPPVPGEQYPEPPGLYTSMGQVQKYDPESWKSVGDRQLLRDQPPEERQAFWTKYGRVDPFGLRDQERLFQQQPQQQPRSYPPSGPAAPGGMPQPQPAMTPYEQRMLKK